jgi:hypothetical protein
MLGLTAFPHGGAQTSAQTPSSAVSANAAPVAAELEAQRLDASSTRNATYPDPLLAPRGMAATWRIASSSRQRGRRAPPSDKTIAQTATRKIAIQPASRHCCAV